MAVGVTACEPEPGKVPDQSPVRCARLCMSRSPRQSHGLSGASRRRVRRETGSSIERDV